MPVKKYQESLRLLAHSLVLPLAGNRELNLRRRESLKTGLNAQFASLEVANFILQRLC